MAMEILHWRMHTSANAHCPSREEMLTQICVITHVTDAVRLPALQESRKKEIFPFFLIPHLVSTLSRHVIDFEGVDTGDSCGEVCD